MLINFRESRPRWIVESSNRISGARNGMNSWPLTDTVQTGSSASKILSSSVSTAELYWISGGALLMTVVVASILYSLEEWPSG